MGEEIKIKGQTKIFCDFQFFKVPVLNERGLPLDESQILFMLKHIINSSKQASPPVGILSSAHRDEWSKAYKELASVNNGGT